MISLTVTGRLTLNGTYFLRFCSGTAQAIRFFDGISSQLPDGLRRTATNYGTARAVPLQSKCHLACAAPLENEVQLNGIAFRRGTEPVGDSRVV